MKRIYVVKGGRILSPGTGSVTPIDRSAGNDAAVPDEVRIFPRQLTTAANDMYVCLSTRRADVAPGRRETRE